MTYVLALELSGTPNETVIAETLNLLASINTLWYLEQWARGESPPKNPRIGGVVWRPDGPSGVGSYESAPIVFERGIASCGPIAAVEVGYFRATEQVAGRSPEQAALRHRVELVQQGPLSWHAIRRSPWGRRNPTERMVTQ